MMNIATQTKVSAQSNQLQHSGVFLLNSPSNSVVANMAWQLNQQFKQSSYGTQFNIADIKPCITRIRLVMHDACVLSIQEFKNLIPLPTGCSELNEFHFWWRFSNDRSKTN